MLKGFLFILIIYCALFTALHLSTTLWSQISHEIVLDVFKSNEQKCETPFCWNGKEWVKR